MADVAVTQIPNDDHFPNIIYDAGDSVHFTKAKSEVKTDIDFLANPDLLQIPPNFEAAQRHSVRDL
jgi:hypothetical protein